MVRLLSQVARSMLQRYDVDSASFLSALWLDKSIKKPQREKHFMLVLAFSMY